MVHLKGATGSNAYKIDGLYVPTEELVGNASVYRKVGDDDVWISYHVQSRKWILGSTENKGTGGGCAFAEIYPPRPLEDCPIDCWEMYVPESKEWVKQPTMTVSVTTLAVFEAYEASQVRSSEILFRLLILFARESVL